VKRALAGKRYFEARAQSAAARGWPWHMVRQPFMSLWVQKALARGHMNGLKGKQS
jgi:hypothetical protein